MSAPNQAHQLTGDAAFAAAVLAGVPVRVRAEGDGKYVMETAERVAACIDSNGQIVVFTRKEPHE